MDENSQESRPRGGSKPVGPDGDGGRKPVKWHSQQKRIQAAAAYAATGSNQLASEISGVPAGTIAQWKTTDWWADLLDKVRRENDDELDTKFTRNIDKTVALINDRLENGDYFYNAVTGEITRKPIGGKDLGVLVSIMVEKRELLRGRKGKLADSQSINQRLEKIAGDIRKLVGGSKLIEGQIIQEEDVQSDNQGEVIDAEEADTLPAQDTSEPGEEILVDSPQ